MLRYAAYIVFTLFLLCGLLAVGAALFRWQWFFDTRNGRAMQRALGRRGVRVFYLLLGLLILALAAVVARDHRLFSALL